MTTIHDLLVELVAEVELAGSFDRLSAAFRDDFTWRVSLVYDALPEDQVDRQWCLLTASVVAGMVPPSEVAEVLAPLLEARS